MPSFIGLRRGGVSVRLLVLMILAAAVFIGGCASSNSVTIGPPAKLAFTTQPGSASAGASTITVTVSIDDAAGHVVTTATNQVTLAIGTNPAGGTLSGTLTATAVAGVATFSNLSINNMGTGYTLAASTSGLTSASSTAFNVVGPPSRLAFTVQPGNVAAGGSIPPAITVSIEDAAGNVVPTATNQVTIAIGTNPSSGTLSGTASVNGVAGVATFSNLSINKTGTGYTLTASASGLTGATSSAFNVTAGAAAKLAFAVQPSNATAGVAISPAVQVTIQDAQGNTVTSATNQVTIAIGTNPASGTLSGTAQGAAVAGVATFSNLSINSAGTGYTLSASATGLTGATSSAFNILVGAAAKLAFTVQPASAGAGVSVTPSVAVSIEDAAGNVVPTATNQVTIAIGTNPSSGTLSGTAAVNAAAGVATFSTLSINKTGNGYTLSASAAGLSGATSNTFNITAGAAAKLAFSVQPSNATAGVAIAPAVQVAIQDAQGNTVTSSTAQVTIAIGTNPASGTLSGTAQANAVAGVATFANLSINSAGTGYTLSASASSLTGATSNAFNILVGAASKLVFTTQPTAATAGVAISPAVQVTIEDNQGNTVTTATNQVTVAIATNPSGGTLSGTAAVNAVNGVATFSTLNINNVGNGYTLTASATGLTSATSSTFNIIVSIGPPAKVVFTVQPSNATAGVAISPAIQVSIEDAGGNVVTSSTLQVTIAIGTNPSSGTLSGTAEVNAVSGVATFSTLNINNAGTGYTLSASASGLTGATSNTFNITPAGAAKLAFSVQPTNVVAGSSITPVVQVSVQDSFGNLVTSATNQITIAIGTNPSSGTLSGTAQVNAVAGVASFSTLSINKIGTGYTLSASGTSLTSTTSSAFNVTAGAANKLAFTVQPANVSAGSSITPAVQVAIEDNLGNIVTSATDQVTVAIGTNPSSGTLSGTAQVNAVAGVATFSTLSINNIGTGYTLTASDGSLTGATSNAFNVTANCTTNCSISGTVTGPWVSGVTITLSGGPSSPAPAVTNSSGNYSFTNLTQGTYTITPSLAGYTYTPSAPSINIGGSTVQNFVATPVATTFSISGTVSYSGVRTGPTLIYVTSSNCTGCNEQAGTSLATAPTSGGVAYTVRGLPSGSYTVFAEIDTLGTGARNESNPAGSTSTITITSADVSGANFILNDRSPSAPVTPKTPDVAHESKTAFINYHQPRDSNNEEIATSYHLYYGTDPNATNLGFKLIAAGNAQNVYLLTGLTDGTAYYFKMTALNANGESAATSVVGPITIGATSGANTVSGSVTFPGSGSGATLFVGFFSNTNGVYFQSIPNPTSPQAYSVAGVPAGTYQQFAVLDVDSNGSITAGDETNFGSSNGPPPINISGTSSGNNIALANPAPAAKLFVQTSHQRSGGSDTYSVCLSSDTGSKRPLSLTLFSAPNAGVPFDTIFDRDNCFTPVAANNSISPTVGDTYNFLVTFSDGTSQVLSSQVTTVLNSFAQNLAVSTSLPNSTTVPLFTWTAPAAPPPFYSYGINLNQQSGPEFWNYFGGNNSNGIPSTQTSVVFNVDGSANPSSTLTSGQTYTWTVQVQDANGNSAQITSTYTVP